MCRIPKETHFIFSLKCAKKLNEGAKPQPYQRHNPVQPIAPIPAQVQAIQPAPIVVPHAVPAPPLLPPNVQPINVHLGALTINYNKYVLMAENVYNRNGESIEI